MDQKTIDDVAGWLERTVNDARRQAVICRAAIRVLPIATSPFVRSGWVHDHEQRVLWAFRCVLLAVVDCLHPREELK